MTILYGIWHADYSDSYVGDSVYSSQDDAEAVCRAGGGRLIEFELDRPLDEKEHKLRRPGERVYWVGMDTDGNGAQANVRYHAAEDEASTRIRVADGLALRFHIQTWAHDEQHAIKIANDRRAQWLAEGGKLPSCTDHDGWGKVT